MMGFSGAVQWWEEWQLRVLVLASLFLQYFLFVAAPLRKRCIPALFRFVIWLAYLGSDAVAIYALAALFNRHKGSGHPRTARAPTWRHCGRPSCWCTSAARTGSLPTTSKTTSYGHGMS